MRGEEIERHWWIEGKTGQELDVDRIGMHPALLQMRDNERSTWIFPATPSADVLNDTEFHQSVVDLFQSVDTINDKANSLSTVYDLLPFKAFVTEQILKVALSDPEDTWLKTFGLIFYQNYRFGGERNIFNEPLISSINELQRKILYFDLWWASAGWRTAISQFIEPGNHFIYGWYAIDIIDKPEVTSLVRHTTETVMKVSSEEIQHSLCTCGLEETGFRIKQSRLGTRDGRFEGDEEMSDEEVEMIYSLNTRLQNEFDEIEQIILDLIWNRREELIQPHPCK